MSEYVQVPLAEVCTIVGGGTPRRSNAAYFDGPTSWATPTDVTALDSLFIDRTRETITEVALRESSARLVPAGTVLMTSRATIGYTAIANLPMATNQGFANLICSERIVPEYLAYWLRDQREHLIQLAGGTTFRELPKSTLKKVRIPLPPLDEQRRIVDILNRAAKIERLRAQAQDRLREFIPALFVSMFGDPVENPNGWDVRLLGDLIQGFQGGKNVQAGNEKSKFRILKVSAVTGGIFNPAMSKPAPDDYAPPKDHFVQTGDLLISRANTSLLVGATALVEHEAPGVLLPDKIWRFVWRSNSAIEPIYLNSLLKTSSTRATLSAMATGTSGSMKNISQSKLMTLPILLPPLSLQRRFVEVATMASSISSLSGFSSMATSALSASLTSHVLRDGA